MPFSAPKALNITSAEITPAAPAPISTSNVSAATRVERHHRLHRQTNR